MAPGPCRRRQAHRPAFLRQQMHADVPKINTRHARPDAMQLVRAVREFDCDVFILKGDAQFSAGSIMEVLTANLDRGTRVTLEAKGRDAGKALARLEALLLEFKAQEETEGIRGREASVSGSETVVDVGSAELSCRSAYFEIKTRCLFSPTSAVQFRTSPPSL